MASLGPPSGGVMERIRGFFSPHNYVIRDDDMIGLQYLYVFNSDEVKNQSKADTVMTTSKQMPHFGNQHLVENVRRRESDENQ